MRIDNTDRADSGRYVSLNGTSWTLWDTIGTNVASSFSTGWAAASPVGATGIVWLIRGGMLYLYGGFKPTASSTQNAWASSTVMTGLPKTKILQEQLVESNTGTSVAPAISVDSSGNLFIRPTGATMNLTTGSWFVCDGYVAPVA